jgi:hypothetical protein
MTHKLPWLIAAAAVGVAALSIGVALRRPASGRVEDGQEIQEMAARLKRLESGIPQLQQSMARTGAQLGKVALATAGASATAGDEDSPAGQERAQQQAEKELRHYDHLDTLARGGGGATATAQLRKNLAELSALSGAGKANGPAVPALDCSDALCRVELPARSGMTAQALMAVHILQRGMGNLSMRPAAPGKPPVYYVAAPGHQLPDQDL